jgi:hypothetical protein
MKFGNSIHECCLRPSSVVELIGTPIATVEAKLAMHLNGCGKAEQNVHFNLKRLLQKPRNRVAMKSVPLRGSVGSALIVGLTQQCDPTLPCNVTDLIATWLTFAKGPKPNESAIGNRKSTIT